ncbi:MAG: hypothetical protein ACTSUG_14925 [Candidatus Helarchaeota archaeon]
MSITEDSNKTIYIIRNFGTVFYKYSGLGIWYSKGRTVGDNIHQDSSWVEIKAQHKNMNILALRNDRALDFSVPGASKSWNNLDPSIFYSSYVSLTFNNRFIWVLRNKGIVDRSFYNIILFNSSTTIPGDTGLVSICSPIDNKPWDNNPPDMIVSDRGIDYINWYFYDDQGLCYNRIIINGTPGPWFAINTNGSNRIVVINKTRSGIFNYTIQYNDSANQFSTDTVIVKVDFYPWDDNPSDIITNHTPFNTKWVNWTLFDDWNGSHYRVGINGTFSSYSTWTNGSIISYPINATVLGTYNYTIEYNDSGGQWNNDTVIITVVDMIDPWSNSPPNITTLINETETINWSLYDSYAPGYYRVLVNGTPTDWFQWTNGTNLQFPINRSFIGLYNYTIEYNDSVGNWGSPDTVWVNVTDLIPPWSNSPADIITTTSGAETINWTLFDSYAPGYYRVLINGTASSWYIWSNGTNLQFPINRSNIGRYNYTIEYNDSVGNWGTPDTVWVDVIDVISPWSNSPSDINTTRYGTETIDWTLWDNIGPGKYRVLVNGSWSNSWTPWTNNVVIQYPINRSSPGIFNYTIYYNDSSGNMGAPDSVIVNIQDLVPTSNSPQDILTGPSGPDYIPWILTDDYGPGKYNVYINSVLTNWNTWINGTSINFPINKSSDGTFNYTIIYNDSNGNWGISDTVIVTVDLLPPEASNSRPINGSYINNQFPTIIVALSDIVSGVNSSTIQLIVNGISVGYNWNNTHVSYTPSSAYSNGQVINVDLNASDNVGNIMSTYSWYFTIDIAPPIASNPGPANSSYVNNQTPTIIVALSDVLSGVNTSSIVLYVDGAPVTHSWNGTHVSYTPSTPFSNGQLVDVSLNASDNVSNVMPTYSWSFTIDITPPQCSNEFPTNQTYTNNNMTEISVELLDNISHIDNNSIQMNINGSIYTLGSSYLTYNITFHKLIFSTPTQFNEGYLEIWVDASDIAGNWINTYYWTFEIDITPPVASNPSPSNQSFTNDNNTQVQVTVMDPISGVDFNTLNLTINNITYQFGDPEISVVNDTIIFTPSISFEDEKVNISLNIKDRVSNLMQNYSWFFYVDTCPPQAYNPFPTNNSFVNTKSPNISMTLIDDRQINESSIILNIAGTDYILSNNMLTYDNSTNILKFEPTFNFSEGQTVYVLLNANDLAGNPLPLFKFSFVIDTLIPYVEILSPNSQTYSDSAIWLNLTCGDANWNSSWYRIYNVTDSVWASPTNLTWHNNILLHFQNLKTYRLYAWVNDSAGNIQDTNITVTFSVDTSAPAITIISPLNQTYGYKNITIIVDNSSNTVQISKIWFRYSNNSFTENFTFYWNGTFWINDTTIFPEKSIYLQVFANSSSGKISKSEVWFTVDLTAPTINITAPNEGSILSKNTEFQLVDLGANDSDIVKVILQYKIAGNMTWNTIGTWINGYNLSWSVSQVNKFVIDTTSLIDSAEYLFRFIALDDVPNDGYAYLGTAQNLIVDNTPPNLVNITLITDNDGGVPYPGYYNGRIEISYNVNDDLSGVYPELELIDQNGWILNSTGNPIIWDTQTSDDGVHHLRIKVYDYAGNFNISNVKTIIVDNTNPLIPTITSVVDSYGHNQTFGYFNGTIVVRFNALDLLSGISIVQLWVNSKLIATNITNNAIAFNSITQLSDGPNNFVLYAYDKCMNLRMSIPTNVNIDNTRPRWTDQQKNLIFEVENNNMSLKWNAFDIFPKNYTIFSENNTKIAWGNWSSTSPIIYNLCGLSIGNRSYRIEIQDIIGYKIQDIVWVKVENNTIKANVLTKFFFSTYFEGVEIAITTNLPGNLTISNIPDPSNETPPPGFIQIMDTFFDLKFNTDYPGYLQLSVKITIKLDEKLIRSKNIVPNSIRIAYWDKNQWVPISTAFNSTSYKFTVFVDHLTYFGIFGKVSTSEEKFPWSIILIVGIIIAGAIAGMSIIIVKRKPKEKIEVTPKVKGVDTEKLIIERDNYIDAAEKALNSGEIKEAIRYFEKIGYISRELGEYDLYNQCIDKVRELRTSLISAISPTTTTPTPPPPEEEKEIKVLRGGEVVGEKIVYKVKVQNNSKYNITDVTVFLISYPRECMGLTTKETRSVPKIESGGFRSLEFEFEPHKDCVEGTVHASVTYIDHLNQSHTESVAPFTIRSVCDLLKPYRVNEEDFDNMILGWQKTGEFKKVNVNIYDLFERSKLTLERHNFYIISAKLYEAEDTPIVRGLIKSFAEGKYAGKKIGMIIEMMGNKDGALSQIKTSSTSEDEGMMASPISEVIEDFNEAGLSLDKMTPQEQEAFIKEKSLQSLRYLLIIHKETSITIYSVNFSEQKLDADLVSGFISAISSFGMELSGGQSIGIRKMEYESLKIVLQQGEYINVGLILDDFPEQWLDLRLKTFVKALENQYKPYLENWSGDVRPFKTIGQLFTKIFEIDEN